jgi:hypothetical protein
MKTALTIVALASLAWALQLKFLEIPKIQDPDPHLLSKIESLEKEKVELQKKNSDLFSTLEDLQKTNQDLLSQLRIKKETPVVVLEEPKKETPNVDYSKQNEVILAKIAELNKQKDVAKLQYEANISQIEGFIQKGETLLEEHLKIKPQFKEGKIRTSDADRQKWIDQQKEREDFLRTELSKLEGQKENLRRGFNTFEAGINLQIQQLERSIEEWEIIE